MYTISLLTALIEYLTILLKYIDTILQIIFTTFVNDIPHIVRSDVYLFADDIKLSRTIKNSDDIQILQDDIHKLFE